MPLLSGGAAGAPRYYRGRLAIGAAGAPRYYRGLVPHRLAIVIAGTRENWPGGGMTPDPAQAHPGTERDPWFGGQTRPGRRRSLVPHRRGGRRPDAGDDPWSTPSSSGSRRRQLERGINRFDVRVPGAGLDRRPPEDAPLAEYSQRAPRLGRAPASAATAVAAACFRGEFQPGERTVRVSAGYRLTAGAKESGPAG